MVLGVYKIKVETLSKIVRIFTYKAKSAFYGNIF